MTDEFQIDERSSAPCPDLSGFGLRDARMLKNRALGVLRPDDVSRAVVHAVTLPSHVLVDTLELQPAYPRKRR